MTTPESPVVTPVATPQSPAMIFQSTNSSSHFITGPKLSLKLDDKNFLLWNQQVEGVVATHKLHRLLVNPQIPPQFNSPEDERNNKVSEEYDRWIVQDQALYTWLLSTFSDAVLPRVLDCRHAFQVWDTIHRHFQVHLKAKTRQLRSELKITKKGSRSIHEYITRIRAIASSLIAAGDGVSENDLVDVVLDGLPEEYNPIVLMAFTRSDALDLTEIESLLLVQEAQLDKFRQELATPAISANLAHTAHRGGHAGRFSGNYSNYRGRGRFNRGGGRGRGRGGPPRPTCQVCGKPGHTAINCWYRYDESYATPSVVPASANNTATDADATPKEQATTSDAIEGTPQAFSVFTAFEPSASSAIAVPEDLRGQGWFVTCASLSYCTFM